jgi:hypothetical protein
MAELKEQKRFKVDKGTFAALRAHFVSDWVSNDDSLSVSLVKSKADSKAKLTLYLKDNAAIEGDASGHASYAFTAANSSAYFDDNLTLKEQKMDISIRVANFDALSPEPYVLVIRKIKVAVAK